MSSDPSMTFSKIRVRKLVENWGGIDVGKKKGKDVYLLKDQSIVRLASGNRRMSYDEVEEIALVQLEMSYWDFDLWIGEN